jgi:hypothetical protein
MPGCLTSASPFAADCQLVDMLWSYVVLTAIWSALAYTSWSHVQPVRAATCAGEPALRRGCVVGAVRRSADLLICGSVIPVFAAYSGAVTVAACLGWRVRKSSAPVGPRPKMRFVVGEYVFITVVLIAGQSVLAFLHVEVAGSDMAQRIASSPILSVDGVEGRVTMFVLFFGLSQVGIGVAARALAKSLQYDWRIAEGLPHRRTVLLAAGVLPLAVCLVPAVHYGALLGSVLLRLALVVFAWWSTRGTPADKDAEFLSWSTFRAGREFLSVFARKKRRRAAVPAG